MEGINYDKPEWSSLPLFEYSLEVLKSGILIDEIILNKREFFILGRQHDIVHIPLDHASVSRRHAVLNFRKDGALMIRDFGSAQGTFLNKTRLDPDKYYKVNVGDLIKFGASTRLYIVKGPEEDLPEEEEDFKLRSMREQAQEKAETRKTQMEKEKERDINGVSWGISFDDEAEEEQRREYEEEDNDDERFSSSKTNRMANLPEYLRKDENYDRKYGDTFEADIDVTEFKNAKDKELLEKIRKKEKKIQNLQEETRRIYLKEQSQDDGLTDGQLSVVNRNDATITTLKQEIDVLLQQIHDKTLHREVSNGEIPTSTNKKRSLDDEDNDDLLDTTANTADVNTNWRLKKKMMKLSNAMSNTSTSNSIVTESNSHNQALSYQDIKDQLTRVEANLSELANKKTKLENSIQEISNLLSGVSDSIEGIIQTNTLQEMQQQFKQLIVEESQWLVKKESLEKVLVKITPALKSLVTSKPPPQDTFKAPLPKESNLPQKVLNSTIENDEKELADARLKALELLKSSIEEDKKQEVQMRSSNSPEPIEKVQPKESFVEPKITSKSEDKSLSTFPKQEIQQDIPSTAKDSKIYKKPQGPTLPPMAPNSGNRLEDGDIVWVPPKKQSGDGRTSLNDKYGY